MSEARNIKFLAGIIKQRAPWRANLSGMRRPFQIHGLTLITVAGLAIGDLILHA